MESDNVDTNNSSIDPVINKWEDGRVVQEVSIQWLSLMRLKKRFPDEFKVSPISKSTLKSVVEKIIDAHHISEKAEKVKQHFTESVGSSYEEEEGRGTAKTTDFYVQGNEYLKDNWSVTCFVKETECVQVLVRHSQSSNRRETESVQGLVCSSDQSDNRRPLKKKRTFHCILFFYQTDPSPCIMAATTGAAWRVARPFIDHNFAMNVAKRIADPNQIVRLVRHHLLGDRSKETLDNPSKLELYKTSHLFCLLDHFVCRVKKESSLAELFKPKRCSIKFSSAGAVRIIQKISKPNLYHIINNFYNYIEGGEGPSKDSVDNSSDPSFDFVNFLQPAGVFQDKLDTLLIEAIFKQYETEAYPNETKSTSFIIRHKNFELFLFAYDFQLRTKPGRFKPIVSSPPAIDDVIDIINEVDRRIFKQKFLNAELKFTDKDSKEHTVKLINCIEGEVRSPENKETFFKIRNMWYEIKVDFLPQLHEDFWNVLNNCLIDEGEEGWLPLPWEGTKQKANLTGNVLKDKLNLSKFSDPLVFLKDLSKVKVCYVSENHIMQKKLIGEILQKKVVKRHLQKIDEILNDHDSEKFSVTKLNKLIGNAKEARQVLIELEKDRAVIKKVRNKKKAENVAYTVINPFPYPLVESLDEKEYDELTEFLKELNEASLKKMTEDLYNQSYLTDINDKYLVFDKFTPQNIELCDILKYTETTLYLYHVKESFGNSTRDACSQIFNAATVLRCALVLNQSRNYLQDFWDSCLNASTTQKGSEWFEKVKIAVKELGREKFFDLFYRRKIVFVYAFLPTKNKAFFDYSRKSPFVTSTLKTEEIDLLKKSGFLDFRGRLTSKFLSIKAPQFSKELEEEWKKQKPGTSIPRFKKLHPLLVKVKPPSNSSIAKMEVVNLAKNLALLGFEFKICEIRRGEGIGITAEQELVKSKFM